jgi:hypothetical protein
VGSSEARPLAATSAPALGVAHHAFQRPRDARQLIGADSTSVTAIRRRTAEAAGAMRGPVPSGGSSRPQRRIGVREARANLLAPVPIDDADARRTEPFATSSTTWASSGPPPSGCRTFGSSERNPLADAGGEDRDVERLSARKSPWGAEFYANRSARSNLPTAPRMAAKSHMHDAHARIVQSLAATCGTGGLLRAGLVPRRPSEGA